MFELIEIDWLEVCQYNCTSSTKIYFFKDISLISLVREFFERSIACKNASGNYRAAIHLVLYMYCCFMTMQRRGNVKKGMFLPQTLEIKLGEEYSSVYYLTIRVMNAHSSV